ncbi:hypothetical protein DEA06_08355 [Microbacterium sp. Gd 4-13]|uniref:HEPN domain-containing protein n=1 Tax=Microbacterium sp. Gd 4-13 TaxID=2173179 RepID=UPI000D578005|nr:HEPN domain-containing protein [Microbacterium sp. Gd 4-13]PVW04776.1 hypothetical protein DEA06_08355 [Microbacterium sp. Gd 4-13]
MTAPLRWTTGRDAVDGLLARRHLDRVPANREHAEMLLDQARRHAASARILRDSDLELAFSAAYDAARKALTAVFAIQGLRPTSAGGHIAVYQGALAQFDPPLGATIKPFDWMRRTRNDAEYPQADSPALEADDVDEAVEAASGIIEMSATLLDTLPPYGK